MAIAPRSRADLEDLAQLIVTGAVSRIDQSPLDTSSMGDEPAEEVLLAVFDAIEAEKFFLVPPDAPIEVRYVPDRQHTLPREGSAIRVFLEEREDGYWLLEPNGWEPLES